MDATDDFHGAKGALLIGDRLLVTLRDDFDWIPWPNHWGFVGGPRGPGRRPREAGAPRARPARPPAPPGRSGTIAPGPPGRTTGTSWAGSGSPARPRARR